MPFETNTVISRHYEFGIHGDCSQPEVTVSITGKYSAACSELRDTVFMEKLSSDCDDVRPQYGICDVINEKQSDGKRICSLRCKCAESADQCLIHIFSGVAPKDMRICEIKADRLFD